MKFNSVTGRAAARVSGRVRRQLNTERAAEELGALETPADAERWLRQLVIWGAGGKVPGTVLNGAVRAVEVWIKLKEAEASFEVVEALRADFKTLREERDSLARDLGLARMGV